MSDPNSIEQHRTNNSELDRILGGGFLYRSINLISGEPGAGKTIFANQLMFNLIKDGNTCLYLSTLTETTAKLLFHLQQFEFFDASAIGATIHFRSIAFLDKIGDVEYTLETIMDMVKEVKADVLIIDSYRALEVFGFDTKSRRKFSFNLANVLATWEVTTFLLGEYSEDEMNSPIFTVVDTILKMYMVNSKHANHHYISVIKKRGSRILSGAHPFEISDKGIDFYPLLSYSDNLDASLDVTERLSSGVDRLDAMLEGGLTKNSINMFVGSTGVGKTILTLHYALTTLKRGEKVSMILFQETKKQLFATASKFGWDLQGYESQGLLKVNFYSTTGPEIQVLANRILKDIEEHRPQLATIDSVNELFILSGMDATNRLLAFSLFNRLKKNGTTTISTYEIHNLFGNFSLTDHGVSFISDSVILLKYIELLGRIGRSITILKNRGTAHDQSVKTYQIVNGEGIRIGTTLRALTGVLTGNPVINDLEQSLGLSEKSKLVLKLTDQINSVSIEEMLELTSLSRQEVEDELDKLVELGLVRKIQTEAETSKYLQE